MQYQVKRNNLLTMMGKKSTPLLERALQEFMDMTQDHMAEGELIHKAQFELRYLKFRDRAPLPTASSVYRILSTQLLMKVRALSIILRIKTRVCHRSTSERNTNVAELSFSKAPQRHAFSWGYGQTKSTREKYNQLTELSDQHCWLEMHSFSDSYNIF